MDEIIELFGYITGELVLYTISLGRHKPNWKYNNPGIAQELLNQRSTWLGWIFWGAFFLVVSWLISR